MDNKIILRNGDLISLSEWQQIHGVPEGKLSEHFSISEYKIGEFQPFQYSELLINLYELFRLKIGKPVIVNSAFRTREKQLELIRKGFRAATWSPHELGFAFDHNTTSWKETCAHAAIMLQIAKEMELKIRIGYKQYWNDLQVLIRAGKVTEKQCFMHTDVCPMYFGKGMPWHEKDHPKQWETAMTW